MRKSDIRNYISKDLRIDILDRDLTQGTKIRISQIREYYDVPKTSLARMLGTSYRQYIRFEQGSSVVPSWVLSSLSLFYNLSLDFVSGLSDEPRPLYDGGYKNINGECLSVYIQKENTDGTSSM